MTFIGHDGGFGLGLLLTGVAYLTRPALELAVMPKRPQGLPVGVQGGDHPRVPRQP
eukprot:CAMPEP_0113953532 /NCGR_PEP_ID=MMETSP1339-20121228/91026_1 /TAXON_ID=94617 /ORGANISM="Fibrocapsa japonica" /LENGTH=55 /DNA_ID=CAMNT_0000962267 /DNA_START=773 /DNA_END=937 /DNA_ORIENTATION=+ /assembly_acc=CAM_ASM_000762